jgi:aqualysin 1
MSVLKSVAIITCLSAIATALPAWSSAPQSGAGGTQGRVRRVKRPVHGEYIVVLKNTEESHAVDAVAAELLRGRDATVLHHYRYALKGFAARMSEQAALALTRHPLVEFVEENAFDEPSATQLNPPNWGLDRINQRNLPLDSAYSYQTTGAGVNAYIIDTGLNFGHPDFAGRAVFAAEFAKEPTGGWDCNGHGTAVASILGGARYGVAKQVTLHIIRVSDAIYDLDPRDDGMCDPGFNSGRVLQAFDWVMANHHKPAVVNLSWEVEASSTVASAFEVNSVDVAAKNLIRAGVTLVNSSGNDNTDVSASHPASLPEVLVVGAVSPVDYRYYTTAPGKPGHPDVVQGSNYGYTVDVHAPGVSILTPRHIGWDIEKEWSGTSFAAPHVAGVVARYLQVNPSATPAQVESYIINTATLNKVKGLPGPEPFYPSTPNRLLYVQP